MDRWKQYLYESHSEDTLRGWARRLSLFRFCRAYGGHANDADSLEVAYRYTSTDELAAFLRTLGLELVKHREQPPQPEAGRSYRSDEFAKFPSLIAGTEWLQQPGHCNVLGQRVFIWCSDGRVTLSISGNYEVTEDDVASAERVERALATATLERIDPPRENRNCICPKYHPAYFLEIRRATEVDAQTLTDLGRSTFAETFARDNSREDMELYLRETFTLEKQLAELRDPRRLIEIAWGEKLPAGYLHLIKSEPEACIKASRPIELSRLYVDSRWIGKGVGSLLMERCLQIAREEGCDTLWLGVWERNSRAQAFYAKYGFTRAGEHVFRLGTDDQIDFILARPVTQPGR